MASDNRQADYERKTFAENWRREVEAAALYEIAARGESDERRKGLLRRLAEVEDNHAKMWADKLTDLGVDVSALQKPRVDAKSINVANVVDKIEAIELSNATWYQSLRNVFTDPDILQILDKIDADEAAHGDVAEQLDAHRTPDNVLKRIWGAERWHRQSSGGWIGDAIYGVNDGLGAIFGIITGVAGFTASQASNSHWILDSGFFGALASTLSMAAGAWLSTKSRNELMETEMAHERREIEEDADHEVEELSILYELKGFSTDDARRISSHIAEDPDLFLQTMASEELGMSESGKGNPWSSALFGGLSTLVGGLIPLIPFFFTSGLTAVILAAVVSIVAHFAVGAAKSFMTVRSWWSSGFEMTMVGVIVGVVSYGLGLLGQQVLG